MMKRWIPILITAVLTVWVASSFRTPKDRSGEIATNEFGRLPVVSNGRFQPLDSLARNSLLQLVEKQTVKIEPWESRGKKLTASEWLMEMTMNQPLADTRPVFRIDHPDLKGLLGVPMEKDKAAKSDGKHYTWLQIQPRLRELQEESRRAAAKDQAQRNPFERAVLRLMNGVALYMRLQNLVQPQNAGDWLQEYQAYLTAIEPGRTAAIAQNAGRDYDKDALERLMRDLQRFDVMISLEPALPVPPHHPERDRDGWMRMGDALMEIARGDPPHFSVEAYAKMASAYRAGDPAAFNDALRKYRIALGTEFTPELGKARWEQVFNNIQPFYKGMVIFVLAGLLGGTFWVRPGQWELLRRTGFWLCLLGLGVHTIGLIFRMALEGRPPVTNLYSSAIFIGWGAVILGLILEAFWKNAIGVVISAVCAFLTLIIAHHLSLTGDTMEMMRAVLDTNFWLATHVVVITLGYSATFVAGFLGIVFILRGLFTSHLDGATAKGLTKMVYGIICFATLFSFVGTVLGGIWADQSWGRFWGWDAKENGALMIVLWNALILHARWGGIIRERGLMNCAIFGNVITAWSWFGVNMLGIGLHSYGFMDAAFKWLMLFNASQVALIVLGCLPLSMWRSFRDQDSPTASPASAGAAAAK
jgi:ABC-type transport system involved in cytochrome c biogenesis permease subunit